MTDPSSSSSASGELARFLARIDDGAPDTDSPDAPRVVFTGALVLDREQEDALVERAEQRIERLSDELGRDRAEMDEAGWMSSATLSDLETFFGRRRLYELVYHKRMEWRKAALGGVFGQHNLHLPVTRRIIQQQISRATNYFFATEPWFSAAPQGAADETAAAQINRYAQWKFRKGGVRAKFESAVEKAFIRGEAVIKTAHVHDSRWYEDILTVAVDPETGEPLLAGDGDYIQESDAWTAAVDPETGEPELDPETGAPVMVLSRDPSTVMPAEPFAWQTGPVLRERVVYHGPEASLVYYLDFLCPEDAESVQKADFIAHLYDVPATQLAQAYLDHAEEGGEDSRRRILDLLREASGMRAADPAASSGARAEDGERHAPRRGERSDGKFPVAECYLTMDVNNDGRPEEVMLILDRENRRPIFYDYTDRVTPLGQRPFHVPRVNPVDGRWYGNSQVDLYWDLQMFIDLTMNRWNRSQSDSARVDFWNPAAVYEGDADPHLRLNAGGSYRLKPGMTADDALQSKYLTDIKGAELQKQIEFFMQVATVMGGVASANDSALAGLDTTKLATGVRNIEKAGQELFAPLLSHLEPGLESASEDLLRLLCRGMTEPEVFSFFEGDVRSLDEIRPADVRSLDFVVEMELTRYKNEQELQQTLHALDVVDRFYAEPPEKQDLVASLYRSVLKLFGVKHADRLIQPGYYLPPGGAGSDPAAMAGAVQPRPDGKSEPNL